MNESSIRSRGKTRTTLRRVSALALALFMLLAVTAGGALAAMPPAGATISNKATATFTDPTLGAQSVDSNPVTTTIQQVYSLNLAQPLTRNGAAGGPVNFPLTLTNTGNGSESYTLAVSGITNPPLTGVTLYTDNGGSPGTPISGPVTLAAGVSYNFFAVATVSGSAQAGNTGTFHVTATDPAHTPTGTNDVLDTVTVTGNGLITITKTANPTSGAPGTTVTYNLAYANSGNNTADTLAITDTIPAGMTYVAGTAKWNGLALNDATGANDPAGIDFSFDGGLKKLSATISSIPSSGVGSSGNLSFQVTIDATASAGNILNTAPFTYYDNPAHSNPQVSSNSTTATVTVTQTATVWLSDHNFANTVNSTTDDANHTDDTVTVAGPVPQGSVVWFENILTNRGNGTDSFNLSVPAQGSPGNSFPVGTTVEIYDSAKTAVITATPALAAASDYHVWVRVSLPLNYNGGTGGNNGGAGWSATLTATSQFDGTKSDPVTDKLGSISPASVDITNNTARSDSTPAGTATNANAATTGWGFQATGEAAAVTTPTVNSGASTDFSLYINNTGSTNPDTYTLAAGSTSGMAALPAGYSVTFLDGGSPVTTVTVAAGANKHIIARLSVTSAVAPTATPQDVFFRAVSATTNAFDIKHDAVTVATVRSLAINPASLNGPITIGGYAYYCHTITNNGNVTEGAGGANNSTITFATTDNAPNFTSTVFYDANGNCSIDVGESTVGPLPVSIAPGGSVKVVVKVYANTNVTPGAIDTTSLTVTTTGAINSVAVPAPLTALDTSTAAAPGGVSVIKSQALDAACDGTADTAYGSGNLNATPGQCIRYQITVTNNNPWTVTGINVNDATPADSTAGLPTLYSGGGSSCYDASWALKGTLPALASPYRAAVTGGSGAGANTVTAEPSTCGSGGFVFHIGDLGSGATGTITFGVQIPH